jgi:signal transduction histidine kinase
MSLKDIQIVMVSCGAPWAAARAEVLRLAGAEITTCGAAQNLMMVLGQSPHHLTLIADTEPEFGPAAVIRMIYGNDRKHAAPTLVLLHDGDTAFDRNLLGSGAAALLAAKASDQVLLSSVELLVTPSRLALQADTRANMLQTELRARLRILEENRQSMELLEHELRTPLGIVVGFASNLRDQIDGPVTPLQRQHADQIVKAALRASGVMDQALDVARHSLPEVAAMPDTGSVVFRRHQRVQLELGALVSDTVALFAAEARQREIELKFSQTEPIHLWGDAPKLMQAVTNLIANALKFTPSGGEVACTVRFTDPDLSQGEGVPSRRRAELVVSDSGPGVPAEFRARIFEQGFRLVRDAKLPGRGLGLSVVREVVELHRGTIRAEDGESGGAAMVMALPVDLRTRARSGDPGG